MSACQNSPAARIFLEASRMDRIDVLHFGAYKINNSLIEKGTRNHSKNNGIKLMHHNHSERIPEGGVEAYTKIAEFKGMDFFREVANTVAESRPKLVLDVGTGPGILLAEIARLTKGVCIGIDCTKKFERYVKLYAERYGVASRVEFILGDRYMLPFKDNSFNVVTQ